MANSGTKFQFSAIVIGEVHENDFEVNIET